MRQLNTAIYLTNLSSHANINAIFMQKSSAARVMRKQNNFYTIVYVSR